jgi:hypothetical protein
VGDYVTLLGAEQVANAAGEMRRAADEMVRAAGYIEETFRLHAQRQEDWLLRFEAAIEKLAPLNPGAPK